MKETTIIVAKAEFHAALALAELDAALTKYYKATFWATAEFDAALANLKAAKAEYRAAWAELKAAKAEQ